LELSYPASSRSSACSYTERSWSFTASGRVPWLGLYLFLILWSVQSCFNTRQIYDDER